MPLHLLGKKSWNVYNTDNIEKVKRDEAAAAARDAAEEQRMQEVDAEHRIQALRGLAHSPRANSDEQTLGNATHGLRNVLGGDRKRRKLHGEDDTDREIRLAKEDYAILPKIDGGSKRPRIVNEAPLTDSAGHINLFPEVTSKRHASKNIEAEAEKAKKNKEFEDQYTMRFSNATGFQQVVQKEPWYHTLDTGTEEHQRHKISKNVWGNEDPGRIERERMRMAAGDPLAAMQKGVAGLRRNMKGKRIFKQERDRELHDLKKKYKLERKRRRQDTEEVNSLEDFRLDDSQEDRKKHEYSYDRDRSHHRGRDPNHYKQSHRSRRDHHRNDRERLGLPNTSA